MSRRSSAGSVGGHLQSIFSGDEPNSSKTSTKNKSRSKEFLAPPQEDVRRRSYQEKMKMQAEFRPFEQERDRMNRLLYKAPRKVNKFKGESSHTIASTSSTPMLRRGSSKQIDTFNQLTDHLSNLSVKFLGSNQVIGQTHREKHSVTNMLDLLIDEDEPTKKKKRKNLASMLRYDYGDGKLKQIGRKSNKSVDNYRSSKPKLPSLKIPPKGRTLSTDAAATTERPIIEDQFCEDDESPAKRAKNWFKIKWQAHQRPDLMMERTLAHMEQAKMHSIKYKMEQAMQSNTHREKTKRQLEYLIKPSPAFAATERHELYDKDIEAQLEKPGAGQYEHIPLDAVRPQIQPRTIPKEKRFLSLEQRIITEFDHNSSVLPSQVKKRVVCVPKIDKNTGREPDKKIDLRNDPLKNKSIAEIDINYRFFKNLNKKYDTSKIKMPLNYNLFNKKIYDDEEFKETKKKIYRENNLDPNPRNRTFFKKNKPTTLKP